MGFELKQWLWEWREKKNGFVDYSSRVLVWVNDYAAHKDMTLR
jgi:hypothetical protein